jgi:hypothetical protein
MLHALSMELLLANATKDLRLLLACFESLLVEIEKATRIVSVGVPVR